MRALVVYESMFGNTRSVALAIAAGLEGAFDVDVVEVSDAPPVLPTGLDLLVVGGPTHVHGLTTEKTRANGALKAGARLVSRGSGIREWLDALVPAPSAIAAAAFDTRISGPVLLWGSAAKAAARRLRSLGFRVQPAASFVIGTPRGEPFDRMTDEELARARAWGGTLAAEVTGRLAAIAR